MNIFKAKEIINKVKTDNNNKWLIGRKIAIFFSIVIFNFCRSNSNSDFRSSETEYNYPNQ